MRALRAVSTEKGRDPARLRPRRLRRLRARCTQRRSPPSSACARRSCRRSRGSSPRPGCCSPAPSSTTCASAGSSAREPDLGVLERLDARDARSAARERSATDGRVEWQRSADVRYRGQNWSVTDRLPRASSTARRSIGARRAFRDGARAPLRHAARAGLADRHPRAPPDRARPAARGVLAAGGPSRAAQAAQTTRVADFGARHGTLEAPVRTRASLGDEPVAGPMLIDEYDTTVVVPPGWTVAGRPGHARARARPRRGRAGGDESRRTPTRSPAGSSRTRSRPPPTRWRRRSSAPRTRRSSATRWTSRPRSAGRPGRRSRRR